MSGRWPPHSELEHSFIHSLAHVICQSTCLSVCLSTISLAVKGDFLSLCYTGLGNGVKPRVLAKALLGRVHVTRQACVVLRTLLSEFLGLEGSPASCSQAPSQREGNPQFPAPSPLSQLRGLL